MIKKVIVIVMFCIFSFGFLWSLKNIYSYINDSDIATSEAQNLISTKINDKNKTMEKYHKLYQKNKQFIGWLQIPGTKINHPVVQTINNSFYLHRDFFRRPSSSGTIFLNKDNDIERKTENLIIYGHNMKDGSMFAPLINYTNKDFYTTHPYFTFDSLTSSSQYKIVAVCRTKIYKNEKNFFDYYDLSSKTTFEEYINYIKKHTCYELTELPQFGKQLITLSTCSYHTTEGRILLIGVKK